MRVDYDYIIIGSGFGGSVSALRLAEKGYKVLVIEKGKWYKAEDFPATNWQLSKWLWVPFLRWFGIMKITIFRHVAFITGTGVGGGSLVYGNTLPLPGDAFYRTGTWAGLKDWKPALKPFYEIALKMLGAAPNPRINPADITLREVAGDLGKPESYQPTRVGVFFGEAGQIYDDPYFDGKGPARKGCIHCGACMTGCRHNAKNSLDKNYLHLAQLHGAEILAEHEVVDVSPYGSPDGGDGYNVGIRKLTGLFRKPARNITAKGVIFSGGVLGTVKLMHKLKVTSLPRLSDRIGYDIRTNNESLISVTALKGTKNYSEGIAIGSILNTDAHSHLEVCRYGEGSGAWKLAFLPYVTGSTLFTRFFKILGQYLLHPVDYLRYHLRDYGRNSVVLLFMQTLDGKLAILRNRRGRLRTRSYGNESPKAFIPEATALAARFRKKMNGVVTAFGLTSLGGIPGTAHILGGAVMAKGPETGVIDQHNRVFGYKNMLVCDGSMISANPGVNPSLSITAITEHAMDQIPAKNGSGYVSEHSRSEHEGKKESEHIGDRSQNRA